MECVDHRFVAALAGTPGARWVEAGEGTPITGPAFGNALFSRYPVRSWEVLRMPGAGPHVTLPLPGPRRAAVIGEEPRVALIADIETPHGVVRVASTHLSFLPGCNLVQLRRLTRHLEQGTPPALIMGDLNLPGGIPTAITGYRPLARHRTYPAAHPLVQLDHLLLKGELGQVRHTAAHPSCGVGPPGAAGGPSGRLTDLGARTDRSNQNVAVGVPGQPSRSIDHLTLTRSLSAAAPPSLPSTPVDAAL